MSRPTAPRGLAGAWRSWAFAAILLALGGFFAWDHVCWVREDNLPELDGDSVLHSGVMAFGWSALRNGWNRPIVLNISTYPPVTHWAAWSAFRWFGSSVTVMRESQALFAGILAIGSGLLVGRVSGRMAGLAAAAACFTFPTLWWQRTVVMLALSATAFLTLAYALLPVPEEPGRLRRALLGGGAMALASLSHTSALYWLVATFLAQLAGAAWGLLRKREGARLHLLDLAVYYTVPAVLGGAWYAASREHLLSVFKHVHATPSRVWTWADLLVFLGWIRDSFLLAPAAWACLAGLLCLPVLWRRNGLLAPLTAGAAGGFFGVVSYPDVHARLFLPLVPFLLVLMTLPLAALRLPGPLPGPRRWVGRTLALGVVLAGLSFSASWRWARSGEDTVDLHDDGALYLSRLERDRALPATLFTRLPRRWRSHAPLPHHGVWPLEAILTGLAEELGLKSQSRPLEVRARRGAPVLLTLEPHLRGEMVAVELAARGYPVPNVPTGRLDTPGSECERGRCFALYSRADGAGGPEVEVLRRWPVEFGVGQASTLVLARSATSLEALVKAAGR